jgi:hypothetical protein
MEIIESPLALVAYCRSMPRRSIFAPAPDIGHDQRTARLQPPLGKGADGRRKHRCPEPAIGLDENGDRFLKLPRHDKEVRNAGLIRRSCEFLRDDIAIGIDARGLARKDAILTVV